MKVVTYNCLTTGYASTKSYPNTEPKVFNSDVRFNRTSDMLLSWMRDQCIILLQEVSMDYRERMEVIAKNNNYKIGRAHV